MKKIIIILVLLFNSLLCISQISVKQSYYVPNPSTIPTTNITNPIVFNGWGQTGNACAGCSSYFWKVTRSTYLITAEDGVSYYYFYIWFYSNSYYSDGTPSSTYLTDVRIHVDKAYITRAEYCLVTRQEKYYLWIRSRNPNALISFYILNTSVY